METDPVIIRRVGKITQSESVTKIIEKRRLFNKLLNEAAARQEQHILNVKTCSGFEHFQHNGELSQRGKENMWYEIDDLDRFDRNKVKLRPRVQHQQQQFI